MSFRTKAASQYKKTVDADEARRKREEVSVSLRQQTRLEQLSKRRQVREGAEEERMGDDDANRASLHELQTKLTQLDQYRDLILSSDPARQLQGSTSIRQLLSIDRDPPIEQVISIGVVPRLVEFLQYEHNPGLQFEAAWVLTNIASGTSAHTRIVVESGAVEIFCRLLRSTNKDVREQAVWALGNIAGDSPLCRDRVLAAGAMGPLLELIQTNASVKSTLSLVRNATWTLSNMCRGKPQPDFQLVQPSLDILNVLINSNDTEILIDSCWALSYLSDDNGPQNEKITAVIRSGVVKRLVELLMHPDVKVKTPALRTIGNIVTGDDRQTEAVIRCNVLPCLLSLLGHTKRGIRKEACWTISNITAGNSTQIQSVIVNNIFPTLVNFLKTEEFEIQKEATWAISNATSGGTPEQIRHLVDQGVIAPLCDLFVCSDARIILVALEAVENILKAGKKLGIEDFAIHVDKCGGIDNLEKLQEHPNEDVYNRAVKIIESYFGGDAEDQQLAPQQTGTGFSFGAQNIPQGGFNL